MALVSCTPRSEMGEGELARRIEELRRRINRKRRELRQRINTLRQTAYLSKAA